MLGRYTSFPTDSSLAAQGPFRYGAVRAAPRSPSPPRGVALQIGVRSGICVGVLSSVWLYEELDDWNKETNGFAYCIVGPYVRD